MTDTAIQDQILGKKKVNFLNILSEESIVQNEQVLGT